MRFEWLSGGSWGQEGPSGHPFGAPRWGGRMGVERTFDGLFCSWGQDGPQDPPRRPWGPILMDLGSIFNGFLTNVNGFGKHFEWIFEDFAFQLDGFPGLGMHS